MAMAEMIFVEITFVEAVDKGATRADLARLYAYGRATKKWRTDWDRVHETILTKFSESSLAWIIRESKKIDPAAECEALHRYYRRRRIEAKKKSKVRGPTGGSDERPIVVEKWRIRR